MRELTLGSLFDGLGGFPLAGIRNGIRPVWASDIEPYPIAVTRNHFPNMRHVGSVTEISGAELEPVDIITFGSPCQDLSVAGKQVGIHDGARSSLFFEAVRIIKEMRDKDIADGRTDKFIRPRFAVWENVPGAFSSNKGKDFQAVLQAFCEIGGDTENIVPLPPKWKWLPAGNIVGNGFSLAWRVLDAAGWGVPQRRKRIFLVADFAGERAGEILFECESVRGDSAESGEAREGITVDAQGSAGRSDCAVGCDLYNGQLTGDKAATIGANSGASANHAGPSVCYAIDHVITTGGNCTAQGPCIYENVSPTEKAAGAHGVCYAIEGNVVDREAKQNGIGVSRDQCQTLNIQDKHAVCYGIDQQGGKGNASYQTDVMPTLCSDSHGTPHAVAFQNCGDRSNPSVSVSDKAYCIPANPMSDRQQAVCFQQNQSDEVRDMVGASGALSAEPGSHQQNYVCYKQSGFADYEEGVGTLKASGGDVVGGVLKASSSRIYDARGNGDGETIPTLTGDHENRITDYTALCVERKVDE